MSTQAAFQAQTAVKTTFTPIPSGLLQRCTATAECEDCRRKREGTLQRAAINSSALNEVPPIVHDILRSPGQPLDTATRALMESRFEYDFSKVRVHIDAKAGESAKAVNALAYTVGNHIIFSTEHKPSHQGENGRLLAHELVHVTQWGDNPVPAHLSIGPVDGPAERQAQARAVGSQVRTTSLQRAVPVCDEYRAEDSGSATPGPGISVNVSRSGKRADVSARLEVHGTEADAAKASTIQSTISSEWNGSFSDGYRINTDVGVTHRAPGQSEDSNATQVELVRGVAPSRQTRHWLVGSRYLVLNLNELDALYAGVAHEFGHLLDLRDRYSESFWSKFVSLFGGDRSVTPERGYEDNIMGRRGGRLESRNVQDLIARYIAYTCVRWRLESPL